MARQQRLATFTMSTSYQNIVTLIASFGCDPFGGVRQFEEVLWRVSPNADKDPPH